MKLLNVGLCLATAWVMGSSCAKAPNVSRASAPIVIEPPPPIAPETPKEEEAKGLSLQSQAMEILNKNCAVCHSAGNAQGNFGSISNVEEMIASGRYLIPGAPEKSSLITKLAPTGNMPPAGSLKKEEIDILNSWVKELKLPAVVPLTEVDVLNIIRKDLESNVASGDRSGIRYFSLHVPQNLGATVGTLAMLRQAFVKVLNSISRAPLITEPKAVDSSKLVFRVQLSDLGSTAQIFETVTAAFYPFGQTFVSIEDNPLARRAANDHEFLKSEMGTDHYLIRADWFAASAGLPRIYSEFLQLGADQSALEAQLGVNHIQNIMENRVVRSGFKNSNVSSQNRIIERHVQGNGLAYWVSYDFAADEGAANIFGSPLGPLGIGQDAKAFEHDGGEMIFQLPNGMFGYYLANAAGVKIDKGPTSIVRQVDAPAQFVASIINGISCMNCHGAGLLYKTDEVRAFASAQAGTFSDVELNKIRNLYVEEKRFKELFDKDNALHFKSLNAMGINPALPDPVNQAYRYYNRALSRADVREELGLSEGDFTRLMTAEPFRTQWNSLNSIQGYIKREELQSLIQTAFDAHKTISQAVNPRVGDFVITPQCIFADALQTGTCIVRQPPAPAVPAAFALMGKD